MPFVGMILIVASASSVAHIVLSIIGRVAISIAAVAFFEGAMHDFNIKEIKRCPTVKSGTTIICVIFILALLSIH